MKGFVTRNVAAVLFGLGALLVASFDVNLSRLDIGRSIEPLAVLLKQRLKPEDEVMTFQTYYQDLPVYLERRITTVEWKGELAFGASVEKDTRDWLIDRAEFNKRWNSPATKYLLTGHQEFETLLAQPPGPMHIVAQDAHAVLIVNHEGPQ